MKATNDLKIFGETWEPNEKALLVKILKQVFHHKKGFNNFLGFKSKGHHDAFLEFIALAVHHSLDVSMFSKKNIVQSLLIMFTPEVVTTFQTEDTNFVFDITPLPNRDGVYKAQLVLSIIAKKEIVPQVEVPIALSEIRVALGNLIKDRSLSREAEGRTFNSQRFPSDRFGE
jgi:hypothetical protein